MSFTTKAFLLPCFVAFTAFLNVERSGAQKLTRPDGLSEGRQDEGRLVEVAICTDICEELLCTVLNKACWGPAFLPFRAALTIAASFLLP